jgi:uncharacterized surface protein with fasciclin (FAS1) repeats
MKDMKRILKPFGLLKFAVLLLLIVAGFEACKKEKFPEQTDLGLNIFSYLQSDPEQYSEFVKVLKLAGTNAYLDAYGTYTMFAPTNDAIKQYLQDIGKNSVEAVDVNELKDLVRLHLIEDTIPTTAFTDGKIPTPTMYGQYLTTGAQNDDGITKITINKIAKIVKSNIRLGNGIVHVIDHVLIKATKTLAQQIADDPSLSIFNEAIKATGWDQKLNLPITYTSDSVGSFVSVLAQTDDVFKADGIYSLADLMTKYSNTGNPTNPLDSLNLFVAYRVLPGLNYMADIVTAPSHVTKAPLEVISVKLSKDTILLNEVTFNGILEKGIVVDRINSDITCTNGVLHLVKGNFSIKSRLPEPVYFDVADQPEFRQLPAIFRKPGKSQSFSSGQLKDITWGGTLPVAYIASAAGSADAQTYWGDRFEMTRLRTSGGSDWVEFKTPVIIKGRYKVWITYRTAGKGTLAQAKFDGELLSRLVDFREYRNTTLPERELEAQGYKKSLIGSSGNFNSRLLGVVDVKTTDRHIFRLEALNNASQQCWIDVVEFRPVDMDQLYPQFGSDGELYTP